MDEEILTMPESEKPKKPEPQPAPPAMPPTATPPVQPVKSNKFGLGILTVSILIAFVIGATGAGLAVYFIKQNQNQSTLQTTEQQYQEQLQSAQTTIDQLTNNLEENNEMIEELKKTPTIPDIEVDQLEIKNNGQTIYTQTDANYNMKILKQTAENVYFYSEPDGLGGYTLYRTSPRDFYQYNLREATFKKLFAKEEFGFIEDISTDENLFAYQKDKKIYVYDLSQEKILYEFDVNEKYTQFGEITFSPNAKKLAYVAAVGNPEEEESAVFVIDLENNITTKIKEEKDRVYHIREWQSNDNSDLIYYYF